jgi:cytochrome c1
MGLRQRTYIGGVAANSATNLERWLMHPQAFSPRTAMPDLGLTEDQARDIAAYLYLH